MSPYRAAVPFLILSVTVGIFWIEYLQSPPDWIKAGERFLFLAIGVGLVLLPVWFERLAEARAIKRRDRRRRPRRSRRSSSQAAEASE